MPWPRGASLGSAGSRHLIHTPVSPGLPENQGLEESPTPGGVAKEELGSRLTGVVFVNGQTAEGADKLKAEPGSRSKKTSRRKTDETELPNSRPRPQGLGTWSTTIRPPTTDPIRAGPSDPIATHR